METITLQLSEISFCVASAAVANRFLLRAGRIVTEKKTDRCGSRLALKIQYDSTTTMQKSL
jgi:hypothetical protein